MCAPRPARTPAGLPQPPPHYTLAGNAYAARRNNPDKSWQKAAYTDEIAELRDPPSPVAVAQGVSAA